MLLTAQVILTFVVLGFSFVPVLADFNATHATNPLWTGHARYHVVWQVCSYVGIGIVALVLLWWPADSKAPATLVAILALCIYGGFFTAAGTRHLYGGELHDLNGYLPVEVTLFGRKRQLDINIAVFGVMVALLVVAAGLLLAA